MTDKEAVAIARDMGYKKYGLPEHSKCKSPDKYGLTQVPRLREALNIAPVLKKADKRQLPCPIQCRLTQGERDDLQKVFKASNCKTMQEFGRLIVKIIISEFKATKKAPCAPTQRTQTNITA